MMLGVNERVGSKAEKMTHIDYKKRAKRSIDLKGALVSRCRGPYHQQFSPRLKIRTLVVVWEKYSKI